MPENSIFHLPSKRALWGPALVFGLSAIVLFGLRLSLNGNEAARLTTSTEITAEQVDLRIEACVQARLEVVVILGRICTAYGFEPERFSTLAAQYIDMTPGFQAINWIDSDWIVRLIVPEPGNESVLNFDLHEHSSREVPHALSAAVQNGTIHRTTLIDLVQGGAGFAVYYPVTNADGDLQGFVNGVFRNSALIESCLAEESLWSQFRFALVEEDGRIAYSFNDLEPMQEWPFVVRRQVTVPDHPWTLFVAPISELLRSTQTLTDEVLVATGVLLAILLAWAMHMAMKRQDALKQGEARYRLLVENQTDMVVKVDLDGCFLFVSPSYCTVFGKTEDELIGHQFLPLVHEDDRESTSRTMVDLFSPPHSIYLEQRAMTKDGWRWFGWADTAVLDRKGEVEAIIAVGRDITARKKLEEKLLHSQKMEAIGQLAGGVAHDFNNILQAMRSNIEIAEQEITADSHAGSHLAEIRRSAERASDLTRQLLAFGRRQVMQPEIIDLHEQVDHTVSLLDRVIGEQVTINVNSEDRPTTVRADARQLEQVLMNLCVNARDAMPSGGSISITIGSREIEKVGDGDDPWSDGSRYASLEVRDTGTGMDEATRAQVFEPFFTTKPMGEGTGLGLATVFGIVRQHEGFIDIESAPGEGTTVTILLPLMDGPMPQKTEVEILDTPGGTETILLAEDDPSVRAVIEEILEESGYQVISASDGNQAILTLDRTEERIDLALLDVVMPGAGGLDVVEHLRESGSSIKVILTSGYSLELARTSANEEIPLLTKPFRRDELLDRIRKVLDS